MCDTFASPEAQAFYVTTGMEMPRVDEYYSPAKGDNRDSAGDWCNGATGQPCR